MRVENGRAVKHSPRLLFNLGLLVALVCTPLMSHAGDLTGAIVGGKADVDIRVRSEIVDQTGIDDKANALTVRTRVGYTTKKYMGISGAVQLEDTTAPLDDYAYPGVNTGVYPVVADPEITEVNQAYVNYQYEKLLSATAGRQRIILDGARFVGNVGWRQNEQTYDAVSLSTQAIPSTTAKYVYLNKTKNIFGSATDLNGHLANASFTGIKGIKAGAYAYLLDFDTGSDSKTFGLSLDGKYKATKSITALYRAEFAHMSDFADNTSGGSAMYYNIEAGAKVSGVIAKVGYEVLGGDGSSSFQTPLATKHKFNGWADKFLSTPVDGLTDAYITLTTKLMGIKLLGTAHLYASDNGSSTYGKEIDLLAVKKFAKNYSVGVKAAYYMADDVATDTTKLWLWTGIKF